ncbi:MULTISPECIES: toll/interleukin-1 receptor domain-containing protein [Bacillus subtilis group]|uniref:toll/interleukin-1 receptor domain-containing protein n=1 Tax=Bacillus subtilis group TaxID=653685 RepID=UPI000948F2CF|nr:MULTISPECIES: toll/interleukin-1 receptor domain-containing protein [Bacillus subtilis group]MED1634047.1 toll/interleukin-1 receptor domain-containing protein [Bacillus licheniformis]OKS84186.1 hypothetical protein BFN05_01385 [Bacillus licheniformis]QGI41797.1 TIR domain-containing protein [Bacillus licheniformis]RWZ56857.1 toll/interleukin-1 receptor domain-containing protein [Bacillus licheniformis]
MSEQDKTIFISHSHEDEKYVKELVNLLNVLKIPGIVCSSYSGYHIPNDKDIYDYLRERLSGNTRVVFILSENYYKSPACLNEMGACWVLRKKYSAILLPNFNFKEIKGAVNPNQMAFKLNDIDRLTEFLEGVQEDFGVKKELTTPKFVDLCNQAITNIDRFAQDDEQKENLKIASIEGVRSDPDDQKKVQIRVRIINPLEFDIYIHKLKFTLEDEEHRKLSSTLSKENLKIYSRENKVHFFSLEMSDPKFEPVTSIKNEIDIKYSRDVWA